MEVSPVEIRVLGALVEKARTTPDAYPLTLNTLRLACNQSTNRDPVTDLDDAAIRAALERLSRRRWARLASGAGSRAPKYRHLLSDTLASATTSCRCSPCSWCAARRPRKSSRPGASA